MANHQMLDNVSHKDVKVITAQSPKFGDNRSYTRVMLSELKAAQAEYPLFFRKNSETGQFEIIAVFGLAEQENLFLNEQGWQAHYLPLTIQRGPFLIGFQSSDDPTNPEDKAVVHIDMDNPRVNTQDGEPLFLAQGGQSPYLQHISSVLNAIHQGSTENQPFMDSLQSFELIESVNLKVQLNNGDNIELGGLYTINDETLKGMSSADIAQLHEQGYLEHIYMIVASLQNMTKLIARKNQRLA